MNKLYISIAALLIAGITWAVWFADRPTASIVYGQPEYASSTSEATAGAQPDVIVDAPQPGTASAQPTPAAAMPQPVAQEAATAYETVKILVESAVYEPCVPGETSVLAAMQTATQKGLTFSGKEFPSLGFFVESINGKNAERGNYWFLYINGGSSDAGASQTTVRPGDVIEWRYAQSY